VEELDLGSGVDINAGIELSAGDDVTGRRMRLRSRRPPKGYRRSDERLRDDVYQRLVQAQDVDVSDVSFDVRDGVVTLEGSVPQRHVRFVLEDLVARCPGVRDVHNRMQLVAK
jgi:Predicted periplasmic or secreted lipoprotein